MKEAKGDLQCDAYFCFNVFYSFLTVHSFEIIHFNLISCWFPHNESYCLFCFVHLFTILQLKALKKVFFDIFNEITIQSIFCEALFLVRKCLIGSCLTRSD